MSINFKEKIENFVNILLLIILDGTLVVIVGLITYAVKWVIEKCYGQPIQEIDNIALYYTYIISKYSLIGFVFSYAAFDVLMEFKNLFKKIFYE